MSGWEYAFSLSKDEVKDATPPGTVRLVEHETGEQAGHHTDRILRFPRPSLDPADPLNWPAWRKAAVLLVASLYGFIANFTSAVMSPALQLWFSTFPQEPQSFTKLSRFIAVNILLIGASNIWWVPLSNSLGRRPTLIGATLMFALCSMWCGLASSYNSLLAARIFQGIGAGAADTVAPALIGDVYFMDERGRAMAIYTVFLVTGSLVGGISGGYIGYQLGWAYLFWISLALSGACFVGMALLVPETLYDRENVLEGSDQTKISSTKEDSTFVEHVPPKHDFRPFTFTRSLGFASPRGSFLQNFAAPWRTLSLPGTWVVMLHYAGLVGGIVTISVIGAQLVSMPPYLWGDNAGLINIGALIGALLGALYTYLVSDARLKSQAKHQKFGLAEPEDRLPTMFPALAIATCGFFVFGFCAQYPGPNRWVGLEVGYGMLSFGLMQVPSIGFNYLIDSYSYLAADCLVMVTILRAIIAFAWTFFVSDWINRDGAAEAFGIFGMLMGIFSILVVPLWLYGKRMRIATATIFTERATTS